MDDSLKFIFQNYTKGTSFIDFWYAFENFLDLRFPHSDNGDTFAKRIERFEKDLEEILLHPAFLSHIFAMEETKSLAELQPFIFRELNGNTDAHKAFASDYSKRLRGQRPTEPIGRLLKLLYVVRCNEQHGQKILPEEWEEIRKRNELIFSLTIPIIKVIDELIITFFVSSGVFAYGALQNVPNTDALDFQVESLPEKQVKGHLFDLGRFPGWRYNTYGWVHGVILKAPLQFRNKFLSQCDAMEGNDFERRLVLVSNQDDEEEIAWAYHYRKEPNISQRINDGIWKVDGTAIQGGGKFDN